MQLSASNWQAIAMIIYFVAMIIIGIWAYTRTNDMDDYMLGGRQLNPLVAALSAGAADMSGWLLMGLPGALYLTGIVEGWIAVGLTIGQWINWMIVAPRLRAYSEVSKNSITVPSFLGNRVRDEKNLIRLFAGIIFFIFFTIYVASGMVAGGKFFESSFGVNYQVGMTIIAGIVVLYTLVGGFLAVSWTDMVQGLMMVAALVAVPIFGLIAIGGFGALSEGLAPGMLNPLGPEPDAIKIISNLSWGLGYFGMPHIIVRFMALRTPGEATSARRIGIGWMIFSVLGACFTALIGYVMNKQGLIVIPEGQNESVFLIMGQKLFPPLIAGFVLAAVLAAIMSTVSSQLLVTSSAVVEDIYNAFTKKDIKSNNTGITLGRISVLVIAILAALIAWNANSPEAVIANSILGIVAFAWAGFGASFGPIVILSLYWRRLTAAGSLTGMIVGAVTTVVWKFALGWTGIYEIIPGFLLCLLAAWIVSVLTYKPNPEIEAEFDKAVEMVRSSAKAK